MKSEIHTEAPAPEADAGFELSEVGRKLTARTGILDLMDDLGRAMATPGMLMLGGGNPAAVPQMQALFRERIRELLDQDGEFDRMLGNYEPPQGNPRFVRAFAELLRRTFGWDIGPENIAVTSGGQSAFFFLLNILGGRFNRGRKRKILFPLAPEYIGYADQGLEPGMFVACRSRIEWPQGTHGHVFKYAIDFDAVETALREEDIAAIAASRPTNPSGNVLTDEEVSRLSALTAEHGIPLILDNAYGAPFPGILFTTAQPYWAPHVILTFSLSKLGLPGTRTGIVVGPKEVASAIASLTAVAGLANGNLGQALVLPWIESGKILEIGPKILRPFYQKKSQEASAWVGEFFNRAGLDWALHVNEGAFFHWLWLKDLPVPTRKLYQQLKARKVVTVPGEFFFFGLNEDWPHSRQCLRLNFSQSAEVVRQGLELIADEAGKAWAK